MIDFNFFSPYISVRKTSKNRSIVIVLGSIILAAFIFGFYGWTVLKTKSIQKDISSMETYLASKDTIKKLSEVRNMKEKLAIMNKYFDIAMEINTKIERFDIINTLLLKDISSSIPKDISFQTMSITSESIYIRGKSDNRQSIAELEYNLKEISRFSSVHITSISQSTEDIDGFTFDIECTIKEVKNYEAN